MLGTMLGKVCTAVGTSRPTLPALKVKAERWPACTTAAPFVVFLLARGNYQEGHGRPMLASVGKLGGSVEPFGRGAESVAK